MTHARRLLQERGATVEAVAALRKILETHPEPQRRLRALWALHVLGKPVPDLLDDPREHLRAWTVRLDAEDGSTEQASRWARLARTDPSPVVRLALAEACRRLPLEAAWPVLEGLATRAEDADDPNLPLMIWYAAWPMAERDPGRALAFVRSSRLPILREFMARQLAATAPVRRVAPPDAPSGTVAFSSLAPRGWDVFLHDRRTGETRRLTDAPRLDYNAMLTNDGRRVAFVSERDGNAELYVAGADGSNLRRLTDDPALDDHPAWSPDGRSILFSSTRQAAPGTGRAWNAVYVMAADGTGVQRLSPPDATDYSPAWAPWGDLLACASGSGRAGGTDIVVMRPDGGERQVVAKDGGWPTFVGRSVLFHSRRDGEWGIWRVNADGSGLKRLSPKGVACFTPRAASHAKPVAVVVVRGGRRQIALLDPDKGLLTDLTSGDADHWNPSISGDGRFVVYHRSADTPKADVEPGTTPELTALRMLRMDGAFPSFSPDGRRVALVAHGFNRLVVLSLDGGDRRTIREGPAFSVAWSKAEDRIAFAAGAVFARPDSKIRIHAVKPDGDDEQPLSEGTSNDAFPSFSPDGRRMVFRSGRGGSKNLFVREPDGVRRLTEGPWTDTMPDWSPSGDLIVFASDRDGEFDLWTVRPDGTHPRKLLGGGGRDNHPKFSPDGRWVVFASERAGYSAEEASLPAQPQPYGDLFAVRLDGTGLVRLTHSPWEEGTPAWSK
ncbi:MAG TPA: hypothetical protein VEJ18_20240 [Planctomycetota bacterium]|nr:hypothetical protein [Planctomycetota bacterium]